jgi:hypothetical protein
MGPAHGLWVGSYADASGGVHAFLLRDEDDDD